MLTTMRGMSVVAVLALAAAPAAAAKQPRLDEALAKAAPKVVAFLKDGKYEAVGVLNFLARVGDGPVRDDLGVLNRNLARRLEVALVQALPDDSIVLVAGAGDSVAESKNMKATHRTPSGRQQFFRIPENLFHAAWGDKNVRPDVFLTGEAVIAPDWKSVTVTVQAFDKNHPEKLQEVCRLSAVGDARTLSEAGVSFATPRGLDPQDEGGSPVQGTASLPSKQAPSDASKPEDSEKSFASVAQKSPVKLEILYNGKGVHPRGSIVEEPQRDDNVTFRLTNDGDETYGVVLLVNGRNTAWEEDGANPVGCYKWILKPGESRVVEGFQKDLDTLEKFKVEPVSSSSGMAVKYGRPEGTFRFLVFREANRNDETLVKADDERSREYGAISRGTVTPKGIRPNDLRALQQALAGEAQSESAERNSRGLIVPGKEDKNQVKRVDFAAFPTPVTSVTIHYYQPK